MRDRSTDTGDRQLCATTGHGDRNKAAETIPVPADQLGARRGIGDRDETAVAVQRRHSTSSGMTDIKARSSKLHRFAEIAP